MAATHRTIDFLLVSVQPILSSRMGSACCSLWMDGSQIARRRPLADVQELQKLCCALDDDDDDDSSVSMRSDSKDCTGSLDCSRSLRASLFASGQSVSTEASSSDEFLPKNLAEPPGLERLVNQVPLTRSANLAAAFAPFEVGARPGLAAPPSAVVRSARVLQALHAQVAVPMPPPQPPPPPALAREQFVGCGPAYISPSKGMFTVGNNVFAAESSGSLGHPFRCHLPCKFFTKSKRGCKDGSQCTRCHLCKWSKGCEETSSKCAINVLCM